MLEKGRIMLTLRIFFLPVLLFFVVFSAAAAPIIGTAIPPANQIIDFSGNAWTVDRNGLCYINGRWATNCSSVQTLLMYQSKMYVASTKGTWWLWTGAGWAQVAGNPTGAPMAIINSPYTANPGDVITLERPLMGPVRLAPLALCVRLGVNAPGPRR